MHKVIFKNPILYLILCNFGIVFVGIGLFPILPLYAGEFGASSSMVGIYLALTYVSISAGTLMAGWLADRFSRRRVFIAAGLGGIPALILLGQATALWQVVLLTSIIWFTGGIGVTTTNLLTGLLSDKKQRGKNFALMALVTPLAAVLGGSAVGVLVERQGYPTMFAALAIMWILWPVMAVWKVDYGPQGMSKSKAQVKSPGIHGPNIAFLILLASMLLTAMTVSISQLGFSLSMKMNLFSAGEVARSNAIAGLVTLPVSYWLGALSDRFGRQRFLVLSFLAAAAGAIFLSAAALLWHFWIVAILLMIAQGTNLSLASAAVTDMVIPEMLSHSLARLQSMNWVAGIIGFTASGYLFEVYPPPTVFMAAAGLSILAAALAVLALGKRRARVSAPGFAGQETLPAIGASEC